MKVKSYKDGSVGQVEVDDTPFGDKILYRTLKDVVVNYQANQRQGSHSTKNRSAVKGTNKKPWRQKGTGRARAGDRKSPIWRGGGVVFGPKPRDYSYQLPTKLRRTALRSAMAGKLQDDEVVVTEFGGFSAPSSKAARKILTDLGSPKRAVIVLCEANQNVLKSFRNFPKVNVRLGTDLCAYDLINGGLVIAETGVLEQIATRVSGGKEGAERDGGAKS
jgi:large subunit ribosomal protein L4